MKLDATVGNKNEILKCNVKPNVLYMLLLNLTSYYPASLALRVNFK